MMKRLNRTWLALAAGLAMGLGASFGLAPSVAGAQPAGLCSRYNCKTDAECVQRCGGPAVCVLPNTCNSACLCN